MSDHVHPWEKNKEGSEKEPYGWNAHCATDPAGNQCPIGANQPERLQLEKTTDGGKTWQHVDSGDHQLWYATPGERAPHEEIIGANPPDPMAGVLIVGRGSWCAKEGEILGHCIVLGEGAGQNPTITQSFTFALKVGDLEIRTVMSPEEHEALYRVLQRAYAEWEWSKIVPPFIRGQQGNA